MMRRKHCKHRWVELDDRGAYQWCAKCGSARVVHCDYFGGYRYYSPKTMIQSLEDWETSKGIHGKPARRKQAKEQK